MLYFWWGCRGNLRLITLGSERVNRRRPGKRATATETLGWTRQVDAVEARGAAPGARQTCVNRSEQEEREGSTRKKRPDAKYDDGQRQTRRWKSPGWRSGTNRQRDETTTRATIAGPDAVSTDDLRCAMPALKEGTMMERKPAPYWKTLLTDALKPAKHMGHGDEDWRRRRGRKGTEEGRGQ